METKLMPCPFCGGEVWIDSYESDILGRHYYTRHVAEEIAMDKGCPMAAGGESSMTEAIEAWNTRYERTCEGCIKIGIHDWCEDCARSKPDLYHEREGECE